jgi:hypothetical protein
MPSPEETTNRYRAESEKIGASDAHDAPATPPRSADTEQRSEALSDERGKTQGTSNGERQMVEPASGEKARPEIKTQAALASRRDQASRLMQAPKKAASVNKKNRAEQKKGAENNDRTALNHRVKPLPHGKDDDEPFFPFRF